jgi:CheY-like chemotaxis protein
LIGKPSESEEEKFISQGEPKKRMHHTGLLDYLMPLMDGLVFYDRLQEVPGMQGVLVLLISAATSLPYEQLRQRNIRLLRKPFDVPDLLQMIDETING